MIFPKAINKGDTIGLIAPSSATPKERIYDTKARLEDLGYKVKLGKNVFASDHGFAAGTGEQRASDIHEMFQDKEVDGIICIRGGNSSCRVMKHIDIDIIKNNPKAFVGFSDITSYLVYFNQKANLVTFHGPMASSNMVDNYDEFTEKAFNEVVNMGEEYVLKNPKNIPMKVIKDGYAEGVLVGGNLSLICSGIGTFFEIDVKDKILFIEDVGETVEVLDRLIWQLKNSGKIDDAAGIILGDFADCKSEYEKCYSLDDYLRDAFADVKVPVMFNIKSGHCYPMSTLPMGAKCSMNTESKEIKFFR